MRPTPTTAPAHRVHGRALLFLGLLFAGLAAPHAVRAQRSNDALRPLATRAELEVAGTRLRERTPPDAKTLVALRALEERLVTGDFRAGDLILLDVPGEVALTDTFSVDPELSLRLPSPTVGSLPLKGVLRAELEPLLKQYIGRFVDGTNVRARSLVRVAVEGEVGRAGYYAVPVDAPLADVIMAANGLTREADLRRVRIMRNGKAVMQHDDVRAALAGGWTAADVPLRPGDSIEIGRGRGTTEGRLRFTWLLVSLAGGVYGLTRAF